MATPDPSVVLALETALNSNPSDIGIRFHLAELLVESGPPAALEHLEVVLAAQPDHLEALRLAAKAARSIGDTSRADAWQRLHDALAPATGHSSEATASVPVAPPDSLHHMPSGDAATPAEPVAATPGDDGVDWDAELSEIVNQDQVGRVTLGDVAGLTEVKQRLETSFLGPMRNPELRKLYGASLRGGLLLWGPPGCGKTYLARAVAGELGAHFVSVGLHDVLDMWMGNSEKKMHELFELARRRKPTVLFFDEVDAIGHTRTDLSRSAGRNVVAQLLAEMDGVDSANDGVFIVGATNQPWDVDPALRRPGRLDRTMLVLPPDPSARNGILELHLRDRPTSREPLQAVVDATEGFSGADLKLVCDDAAQQVMAEALRNGVARPIATADLITAARQTRPSTLPWFETAQNFATFANATGEYDELVSYLQVQKKQRR